MVLFLFLVQLLLLVVGMVELALLAVLVVQVVVQELQTHRPAEQETPHQLRQAKEIVVGQGVCRNPD
jgi:hypothetical protein